MAIYGTGPAFLHSPLDNHVNSFVKICHFMTKIQKSMFKAVFWDSVGQIEIPRQVLWYKEP